MNLSNEDLIKEVLKSQQDMYQNRMQARSRIAAAADIANAINNRNNNNFLSFQK